MGNNREIKRIEGTKEVVLSKADLELVQEEWFLSLLDSCHAIIVETIFNSNIELIKGKWLLGQRISEENENFERKKIYGKEIVKKIAEGLGRSQSDIYFCVQFYKKYQAKTFSKALENLPEGKKISWNKVVNKYLSDGKKDKKPRDFISVRIDEEKKTIWLKAKYKEFKIQYLEEEGGETK